MDYKEEIIDALVNVCVKAKEEGMNLAWKCAKKIAYREDEMCEIFNDIAPAEIFGRYSASEAIAKIKEYEEKQFKKSYYNCAYEGCQVRNVGPEHPCGGWKPKQTVYEIKVGDEVVIDGRKGIIIRPVYYIGDREPFVLVWYGTHMSSNSLNNVTITGRHFPQIVEVLEQIKEREK